MENKHPPNAELKKSALEVLYSLYDEIEEGKKLDEANTYRNILVAMNLNQHQFFVYLT